jgi:hypothetical protein
VQDLLRSRSLHRVKLLHTVIWAILALAIIAIPAFAARGQLTVAVALIGVVFVEVLVLALNGGRCPLTGIAGRHTDNRQSNFDIYLPEWLARHNKLVFGLLYVFGIVATVVRWLTGAP